VNARDRFIREAVLQQGYLPSRVANFLDCHLSNVSRALQKSIERTAPEPNKLHVAVWALINGNPVRFTGSAEKMDQFGVQGSGNIRAAQGLIC